MSEREKVYLGLGSNLGDRLKNLSFALRRLAANARIELRQISSIYETEPYGFHEQPPFLNCVVEVQTSLPPVGMLIVAKSIEEQAGRRAGRRWGPREIDVDILCYEKSVVHLDFLQVPHSDLTKRRFVLAPFSEIAPDFVPPETTRTISEMYRQCRDTGAVQIFGTAHLLTARTGEELS